MGLLRSTEDFINLTIARSSLMILKDCKVGRAIKRFACSSLVTMCTFKCLRSFCMVFLYTELFMSLNKSFSNEGVCGLSFRSVKINVRFEPSGLLKLPYLMNFYNLHPYACVKLEIS